MYLDKNETIEYLEYFNENELRTIQIFQNKNLYCFTSDSILLANFSKARKGDRVADFCAGCGVVGFQFLLSNPCILSITFVEIQKELHDLAEKTIAHNHLKNAHSIHASLQDFHMHNKQEKFDIILCNPPYEKGGYCKNEYHLAICRKEILITLNEIIQIASQSLQFGGKLILCHKIERLAEVIYTMHRYGIEAKKIQYVKGSKHGKVYLFLIEGRKGGKVGLEILDDTVNFMH